MPRGSERRARGAHLGRSSPSSATMPALCPGEPEERGGALVPSFVAIALTCPGRIRAPTRAPTRRSPSLPGGKPEADRRQRGNRGRRDAVPDRPGARRHHLRPLRSNHDLRTVAASQVYDMVRWNYFADECPSGQTAVRRWSSGPATRPTVRAISVRPEHRLGDRPICDPGPAWSPGGWPLPPPRRSSSPPYFNDAGVGMTPAVPASWGGLAGATYAIEFAARGT